ncbi:MAG TPA: serine/threonine-protein kinase [Burkholderiales bacterium]
MIPQTLGRYQIIAELGRGAMGTVYHGIDPTIERPVALKVLNAELPAESLEEVKGRFLREAKSAGRLNHPNIVTIYEFGEADGRAFMAMEFLEGRTLLQLMREARPAYEEAAAIISQIAEALDYAHRFGVVHRDIKPANIMVSSQGVATITDFGIAHLQSSSMTATGAMLGSPRYMAPEHVLGKQIDGRADIFSLGIVLYELLARRTPFEEGESATIFSLMQRIVNNPVPPLKSIVPDVPAGLEIILARALAKKPDERYQRAGEFAADLRNYKTLQPAPSPQPAAVTAAAPAAAAPTATAATPPAASTVSSATAWERAAAFLGRKGKGGTPAITPPAALAAGTAAVQQAVAPIPPAAQPVAPAAAAPLAVAPHAVQPASRFAAASAKSIEPGHTLLGDLDRLSDNLDEVQRRFVEEEAIAMANLRKNAPRAKDWDSIASGIEGGPLALGAGAEAEDNSLPGGADARKSGVFGLLRQQAAPGLKSQASARRDAEAEAMLDLDARLRAGYDFLLEFCRELNEAAPLYAGKHDLLFYGPCPPLFFHEATTNARFSRVDDRGKVKDVVDHLLLSYFLSAHDPGRATVTAVELPKFREVLDSHEVKYDCQEIKNDFKQILRATFNFEFKFICSLTLKANYAEGFADVTCRNIGPLGRSRYLVPAAELDVAFFEELSKLMLGFPSTAGRYAAGA